MESISPSPEARGGLFHDAETPGPKSTPERRLLLAVLRRAIWDFALYRKEKEGTPGFDLAVDAAGWIFWDGEEPLTFKHICNVLDLDPEMLRGAALTLQRKDIEKLGWRIETED